MNDYYTGEYSSPAKEHSAEAPKSPALSITMDDAPHMSDHSKRRMHHHQRAMHHQGVNDSMNYREFFKRIVKYLIEGLAVAIAAYIIFRKKREMDMKEVALLGVTAAVIFAGLDTFAPTISFGAKLGTGFGLGQALIL
jgi:hypothetical protein